MADIVDIFPKNTSSSITRLEYPENQFRDWLNDVRVKAFVLFIDDRNIVYYNKQIMTQNIMKSIHQIYKGCQVMEKFGKFIDWYKIKNKFRIPIDNSKKNADVRLGFKLGNKYLVKKSFTFGLRTVRAGTAHVIQTMDIPLILFIFPKKKMNRVGTKLKTEEKIFPYKDIYFYSKSILLANGVYRVPPETRYVLYSTQRNFFSLDIVPETMQMPFSFEDPVKTKITKLPGVPDKPPQTPYIEEQNDEIESPPLEPVQQNDYWVPLKNECPQTVEQTREFVQQTQEFVQENEMMPPPPPPQQQNEYWVPQTQEFSYIVYQNPAILERQPVLNSRMDFVKMYQDLKAVDKGHPKALGKTLEGYDIFHNPDMLVPDPEPMDLSVPKINQNDLTEFSDLIDFDKLLGPVENKSQFDKVLLDISCQEM